MGEVYTESDGESSASCAGSGFSGLADLLDRQRIWPETAGMAKARAGPENGGDDLLRSRALLAKAEQLSNTGAWEWDLITDVWTFSDQWLAIHGCTRSRMTTADLLPIAHPEDRPLVERAFADLQAGGRPYRFELRIIRQDTGEVRMIQAAWELVKDAAGRPVKVWGAAQDITERRLAEDKLRRAGERQAFIVKLSDAVRSILDPVELHVTACRLLGEYLGADRVHYAEYCEAAGYVIVQPDYTRGEGRRLAGRYTFAEYGDVPVALKSGQTMVIADTQVSDELSGQVRETCRQLGIRAFVATPSMREGTLVRSLSVASAEPRRWTHAEVELIRDAADRTWAAVERACAEAALWESEKRLRMALTSAGMGMWRWDDEERRLWVTPEHQKLFGLPTTTIEPQTTDYLKVIQAEEVLELDRGFQHVWHQGGQFDLEYRIRRADDGALRWIHSTGKRVSMPDGRDYFLGISRDVTARKTAEIALQEREWELRRVLDTAAIGLARCGQDRRYIWANHPYCELVGIPQEAIAGMTVKDALGPGYQMVEPFIKRVLNGERIEFETELPILGGFRHLHIVASPDEDGDGRVCGYFVSVADISDRKALEREVLRASETERQRVAAELHDGICQELVAIGFAARGVQRQMEKSGSTLTEPMGKISNAISQAAAHTRQIAHQMNPTVGGGEGLKLALQKLALSIAEKGEFRCEFECSQPAPDLDPVVGNQLYRIAQEAIANAVQHSGGKRIRVALTETGSEIRLQVSDDGCGLTQEAVNRPGFGLRAMKYRAGLIHAQWSIRKGAKGGMDVLCAVPKVRMEPLG